MNSRPVGALRTVRTPETVERVTQALLRSLNRSNRRIVVTGLLKIGENRSPKMTVWNAVGKADIIGPYFFEDHNGNAAV
ncbi:hypothetical protein SK128_022676 [Halocaridina rubra]|uniref:Uncharacterized protein n=1 Tax=Halocaridina rubra TaxID=373956 RepID=A0AAN8X3H1_HALRR